MKKKALIILLVLFVFAIMSIGVSAWPCKDVCGLPNFGKTCTHVSGGEVIVCGGYSPLRPLPSRTIY